MKKKPKIFLSNDEMPESESIFDKLPNSLDESDNELVVDAVEVCGGDVEPPFCMGDVLPFVYRCNVKLL